MALNSRNSPRDLELCKQPKWKILGKRRLRARKKAFIIKELGGKCDGCGSKTDLELDHPGHDRHYRSGIVTKSWEFIRKEVRGARLLCRSCNGRDGIEWKANGRK